MESPTTLRFHANIQCDGSRKWGDTVCKKTIMAVAEPLVFAEDKSSELEAGGHIHKPKRWRVAELTFDKLRKPSFSRLYWGGVPRRKAGL
jgi:hypothetical protein